LVHRWISASLVERPSAVNWRTAGPAATTSKLAIAIGHWKPAIGTQLHKTDELDAGPSHVAWPPTNPRIAPQGARIIAVCPRNGMAVVSLAPQRNLHGVGEVREIASRCAAESRIASPSRTRYRRLALRAVRWSLTSSVRS